MQIGEVAERTGLSLRTIRYYEEVELVVPSARSQGGFRLYTQPDIDRLDLVRKMKPLGFQLDEMRALLTVLDPRSDEAELTTDQHAQLRQYCEIAEQRCAELRAKLEMAEELAGTLRTSLNQGQPAGTGAR